MNVFKRSRNQKLKLNIGIYTQVSLNKLIDKNLFDKRPLIQIKHILMCTDTGKK